VADRVCERAKRRDTETADRTVFIAAQTGGHYIDQFTYAERATDWRGNNNIAETPTTPPPGSAAAHAEASRGGHLRPANTWLATRSLLR
jgi:hypothetical protein